MEAMGRRRERRKGQKRKSKENGEMERIKMTKELRNRRGAEDMVKQRKNEGGRYSMRTE